MGNFNIKCQSHRHFVGRIHQTCSKSERRKLVFLLYYGILRFVMQIHRKKKQVYCVINNSNIIMLYLFCFKLLFKLQNISTMVLPSRHSFVFVGNIKFKLWIPNIIIRYCNFSLFTYPKMAK